MAPKISCYCRSHNCNGARITKKIAQAHQLDDARANAPIQDYHAWAQANPAPPAGPSQVQRRPQDSLDQDEDQLSEQEHPAKRARTSQTSEDDSESESSSSSSSQAGLDSRMASPPRMPSPAPDTRDIAPDSPALRAGELGDASPTISQSQADPPAGGLGSGDIQADVENSDDDGGVSETELDADPIAQEVPIATSGIERIETSNMFIRAVREATLDDDKLPGDALYRPLCTPPRVVPNRQPGINRLTGCAGLLENAEKLAAGLA